MYKHYTQEEDDFLEENRNKIPTGRMAKILGRGEAGLRSRMKFLRCLPDKEAIEKFRKDSQIKPGSIPPNKGKKITEYASPEAIKRMMPTQFKKGSIPPNHKPVGHETIVKQNGYVYVKVAEGLNQFKLKHRLIYEQHFGPIPRGYNVEFKDRDKYNYDPENLILRTRKENAKINSGSAELTDNYVAGKIMGKSKDPALQEVVKNNKPIIELKRHQFLLKRAIDEATRNTTKA